MPGMRHASCPGTGRWRLGWAVWLPTAVLFASCLGGFVWTIDYEFAVSAARDDGAGEIGLQASGRGRGIDLDCRDPGARFTFDVRPGGIDLTVRNLGPEPLRLLLEEARLVDPHGAKLHLYKAGADNSGPARSLVAAGSKADLYLWPAGWMRSGHRRLAAWRADSPLDGRHITESSRAGARARARPHLGRTFEIVLPVERGGRMSRYRFRFTVEETVPKLISWA